MLCSMQELKNSFLRIPEQWVCGGSHTALMFKNSKKKIEKGVAFPTCISINNTVCHFSPLAGDETVLAANDIVKM